MMRGSYCPQVADNINHNALNFDGKRTLHATGIIVTATGPSVFKQGLLDIPMIKLKNAGQTNAQKRKFPSFVKFKQNVLDC